MIRIDALSISMDNNSIDRIDSEFSNWRIKRENENSEQAYYGKYLKIDPIDARSFQRRMDISFTLTVIWGFHELKNSYNNE